MDPKLTTKPAAFVTFILMCWVLTGLWPFGRPVSATSMLRVRFTNRRKEKLHPAPNVVMRPRRPKTSACPVRKHQSGFPVKQLFGEVVTECLRNEFRKHTRKIMNVKYVFGKCFFFIFHFLMKLPQIWCCSYFLLSQTWSIFLIIWRNRRNWRLTFMDFSWSLSKGCSSPAAGLLATSCRVKKHYII